MGVMFFSLNPLKTLICVEGVSKSFFRNRNGLVSHVLQVRVSKLLDAKQVWPICIDNPLLEEISSLGISSWFKELQGGGVVSMSVVNWFDTFGPMYCVGHPKQTWKNKSPANIGSLYTVQIKNVPKTQRYFFGCFYFYSLLRKKTGILEYFYSTQC